MAEEAALTSLLSGLSPVLMSVVKQSVAQTLPQSTQEILVKEEEEEFKELHADLNKKYFGPPGMQAESEILHGEPAKEILELADDLDANIIVMGTRGRNRLASTLLGSVAVKVIRDSSCPVPVVRTKKQ